FQGQLPQIRTTYAQRPTRKPEHAPPERPRPAARLRRPVDPPPARPPPRDRGKARRHLHCIHLAAPRRTADAAGVYQLETQAQMLAVALAGNGMAREGRDRDRDRDAEIRDALDAMLADPKYTEVHFLHILEVMGGLQVTEADGVGEARPPSTARLTKLVEIEARMGRVDDALGRVLLRGRTPRIMTALVDVHVHALFANSSPSSSNSNSDSNTIPASSTSSNPAADAKEAALNRILQTIQVQRVMPDVAVFNALISHGHCQRTTAFAVYSVVTRTAGLRPMGGHVTVPCRYFQQTDTYPAHAESSTPCSRPTLPPAVPLSPTALHPYPHPHMHTHTHTHPHDEPRLEEENDEPAPTTPSIPLFNLALRRRIRVGAFRVYAFEPSVRTYRAVRGAAACRNRKARFIGSKKELRMLQGADEAQLARRVLEAVRHWAGGVFVLGVLETRTRRGTRIRTIRSTRPSAGRKTTPSRTCT
ncbi:hypothetical protein H0H81_009951, partial [Sphagnurus paluster]